MNSSKAQAWLLAGTSLIAAGSARVAYACPAEPYGPQEHSAFVTSDGALLFRFACSQSAPCPSKAAPSFVVLDDAHNTIAGSVVKFGSDGAFGSSVWIAWRPAQPFASGVTYQVGVPPVDPSATFLTTFRVDPQASVDPSKIALKFTAKASTIDGGDQVCCPPAQPWGWGCGSDDVCFASKRQETVFLQLLSDIGIDSPFQWLYRVKLGAQGTEMMQADSTTLGAWVDLQMPSSQYCYSVDAVDPLSDAVMHVGDGCTTLDVDALALRPLNDEELKQDLSACASPPAGYEADWQRLGLQHALPTQQDASLDVHPPDAGDSNGTVATSTHHATGCALASGSPNATWLLAFLLLARRKRH